jgi:hypothetical protein
MTIKKNGCWSWAGKNKNKKYPTFWINHAKRSIQAHRVSYVIHSGMFDDDLFVLHKCDNVECTNPEHLFLGSSIDNIRDMVSKKRHLYGEKKPNTNLKESDIHLMFQLRDRLSLNGREIARLFNLDSTTVYDILNKKTWRHLWQR